MHDTTLALSDRIVNGVAWRIVGKLLLFAIRFGVLVVLARLLPVEAFGIIGLSLTVTSFASILAEVGLMPALIQCKDITEGHIRVAFTLSLACGAIFNVVVWLCARSIAGFFQSPDLAPVLQLMSLTFIFKGLGTTAEALLRRKLNFRKLSLIDVLCYFLGFGVVGISLAVLGFGVWALAWGHVITSILEAYFYIRASPHSLIPSFAFGETGRLLKFGAGETLNRVVSYAASQGDYFVVGRWLGAAPLGLYSRAYNLMVQPIREFNGAVNNVLFPAYAEIQEESTRLKRAFLSSLALSNLFIAPALAVIAIAAPDLINGLFGAKWEGTIVPLQILCVGGIFRAYGLADSLALAKGAVCAKLWRQAIYAALIVVCSVIGSRWGIAGVSCGVVVALAIFYLLMTRLSIRLIDSSWSAFLLCLLPGLLVAASIVFVALPVALLLRSLQLHNLIVLAVTLLISAGVGLATGLSIPKRWYEQGAINTISKLRRRFLESLGLLWQQYTHRRQKVAPDSTTAAAYAPPEP